MAASLLDAPSLTATMNARFFEVSAIFNKNLWRGKNLSVRSGAVSYAKSSMVSTRPGHWRATEPNRYRFALDRRNRRTSRSPRPLGRLGGGLLLVARDAERLKVLFVVQPTTSAVHNVIDLELQRDDAAGLAGVLVTYQDRGTLTSPRSTTTARTPAICTSICDGDSEWSSFGLLNSRR
jgi:hypothetical protein